MALERRTLDRLVATAEAAQKAGRTLERIFDGLEKRQINLVQAGLQMSATWLEAFGSLEKRGQSLAQILNVLARDLGKVSSPNTGTSQKQGQTPPYLLSSTPQATPPAININLNTPDLASMQRAEPQLASVLARAVTRGMRGL